MDSGAQTLTFKTISNELFEIKYKGSSDLLDNLEPDSNEIIDLIDNFTLYDLKISYYNYLKFIHFRKILQEIKLSNRFWKKNELIKYSDYDLNLPFLNWLMVYDSNEERKIKEIVNKPNLSIHDLKYDNLILYNLFNYDINNKLLIAVSLGHLEVVKYYYQIVNSIEKQKDYDNDPDIMNDRNNLIYLDVNDNIEVCKTNLLLKLLNIAILYHQFEIVLWIDSIYSDTFDEKQSFEIFRTSVLTSNVKAANWIYNKKFNPSFDRFINRLDFYNIDDWNIGSKYYSY